MKDNGDGNARVFALTQALPNEVVQFLWANPLDPEHMRSLEQNIERYPVKGIKLHQAWEAFEVGTDPFCVLVEVARSHAMPIFVHLYSRQETSNLLRFILQTRDAVFIVGHMLGLGIIQYHSRQLGNVFFDTSGSERVRAEDIIHAVRMFGDEHVVFGSDTSCASMTDQIREITRLGLPEAAVGCILGGNMEHLLGLSDGPISRST